MCLINFKKVEPTQAVVAYSQLVKAITAVFSGDVDPLINQLDYKKARE